MKKVIIVLGLILTSSLIYAHNAPADVNGLEPEAKESKFAAAVGYYGTDTDGNPGFAFINVGLNVAKEIKFSEKFSVPVFVRYTYNDYGYINSDDELVHNFLFQGELL